jgi:hypothetical protein
MIADMSGRNLGPASQSSHLRACKRFAAWLGRSPETAKPDDVKYFQQYLVESGPTVVLPCGVPYGRLIGLTKGGMNTKLHAVTDTSGRPVRLFITAGLYVCGPVTSANASKGTLAAS